MNNEQKALLSRYLKNLEKTITNSTTTEVFQLMGHKRYKIVSYSCQWCEGETKNRKKASKIRKHSKDCPFSWLRKYGHTVKLAKKIWKYYQLFNESDFTYTCSACLKEGTNYYFKHNRGGCIREIARKILSLTGSLKSHTHYFAPYLNRLFVLEPLPYQDYHF